MFKLLWCSLFGHKYRIVQRFGKGARRVKCTHCSADWGMHDETKSCVPWGGEFEEMYEVMGYTIKEPMFG